MYRPTINRTLRATAMLCAVGLAGCSGSPSRIVPPNIDPETAAAEALELYDADHDQSINEVESLSCPGVKVQFKAYDLNGDGLIGKDEFAERIRALRQHRVGLTRLQCQVRLNGRPLQDAVVLMEPEPYLGDEIKSATGTTNSQGVALMGIAQEELPSSQQGLRAVHYGTYKVRITHPTIMLPEKHNLVTELGYETIVGSPTANFHLRTP